MVGGGGVKLLPVWGLSSERQNDPASQPEYLQAPQPLPHEAVVGPISDSSKLQGWDFRDTDTGVGAGDSPAIQCIYYF